MAILIRPTEQKDLPLVQALWSNGDVMQFVGFPNGLVQSDEDMARWHSWIQKNQPHCMHYSIFDGDEYCGETYYEIDRAQGGLTSVDIKLYPGARGRGIASKALSYAIGQAKAQGARRIWVNPVPHNQKALALYARLGFVPCPVPPHILEQEGEGGYLYLEKSVEAENLS